MTVTKASFDKLYTYYDAITTIDRIMTTEYDNTLGRDCKLDQVLNAVKQIPKGEYDPEISDKIVNKIREAIVQMYKELSQSINEEINTGAEYSMPVRTIIDENVLDAGEVEKNMDPDSNNIFFNMERGYVYGGRTAGETN